MQGDELRDLRKAMGMTQAELADALGLTQTFIGLMERGTRAIEKRTELAMLYLADQAERAKQASVRPMHTAARIAESVNTEGTVPAEVLNAMLDRGLSPVQAWREYRGLTQAALAEKAGLTQPYIVKIESGKAYGRPASRKAIAAALDAPLWALEDND